MNNIIAHVSERVITYDCNIIAMMTRKKSTVAKKPMSIHIEGYEVVEKTAMKCATSARILVPKHWIGKRVKAIRIDP